MIYITIFLILSIIEFFYFKNIHNKLKEINSILNIIDNKHIHNFKKYTYLFYFNFKEQLFFIITFLLIMNMFLIVFFTIFVYIINLIQIC